MFIIVMIISQTNTNGHRWHPLTSVQLKSGSWQAIFSLLSTTGNCKRFAHWHAAGHLEDWM